MCEEMLPGNIWKIEVPLLGNPLKAINAYYIPGEERNLIIDTGMRKRECLEAISTAIKKLKIDLTRTDFFITHFHSDHIGLISDLAAPGSTVYFNRIEADTLMSFKGYWEEMCQIAGRYGFDEEEMRSAVDRLSNRLYRPKSYPLFTLVQEGDRIKVGDYLLQCIETPGHSPGHTCLFEPDKKILFSGDHVLNDITPFISGWHDGRNPLQDYLDNLEKVSRLTPDLVFPGHGNVIHNCQKRIRELKEYHRARAEEILSILRKGGQDTIDIASQMTWRLKLASWDKFSIIQQWLAAGETIAHLKYLEYNGEIYREAHGNRLIFYK